MFYGFDLVVPPTRIPRIGWLCVMILNGTRENLQKTRTVLLSKLWGRGETKTQTNPTGSLQTIETSLIYFYGLSWVGE